MSRTDLPSAIKTLRVPVLWIVLCALAAGPCLSNAHAVDPTSYGTEIQPILAKHCVLCHGPDDAQAGLRLDNFKTATSQLESEQRAIVPTHPELSELIKRVASTDAAIRMPPEGPNLTESEIELLSKWIREGAKFDKHWAYRPIEKPATPSVADKSWVRNPIDNFVLSRLESANVTPSPVATPATLAKRLAYDLTGLPPEPAVLNEYLINPDDAAYVKLVNTLIESEHFGERWARHWLDKARYADSDGYEKDRPRPNAWLYRDWVINAINADIPYDVFTREQLAGDLIIEPSADQRLATAFHRQTLTNTEGGVDQEQFRVEATFDRTETTAAIWLGLTMTCARCHNHKYDQISQAEYYRLFAFFDDIKETNANFAADPKAVNEYKRLAKEHQVEMADLENNYSEALRSLQPEFDTWIKKMEEVVALGPQAPLSYTPAMPLSATSSSGAVLQVQEDGAVLVTGPVTDKDKYTLVFELPGESLSGIKLEALPHKTLPSAGPGRAPNGNFVLSELRANIGKDKTFKNEYHPIHFSHAESNYSQTNFEPAGALQKTGKSGWAIAPKMGTPHQWLCLTEPVAYTKDDRFLQVVLDQQYGGKHLLGHFRVSTIAGGTTLQRLPTEIQDTLKTPANKRKKAQTAALKDYFASQHAVTKALAERLEKLKAKTPSLPTVAARVISATPRTTRVLRRGDFLQPEDEVETDIPTSLNTTHPISPRVPTTAPDRLDLAEWLTHQNNPLTPRVSVNQIWAQLFGRGLVGTVNDFGVRGDLPTHPRLLEWLAWNYPRQMKWSRKTLIKTIVLSATYRQASKHRKDLAETDPTNKLLARQNRVRVSGEVIRDLHLAVSGLLSRKIGGPSVFPPLPSGVAELSYANNFKWKTSEGEDAYRRGMYTFFKRTSPYPNLISFDCPDSNTSRLQREISNTPLQALITLNNRVFFEASQAFAKQILANGGATDHEKLTFAIQKALIRQPKDTEVERFERLLNDSRRYYADHPEDAEQVISNHRSEAHAKAENAAWVVTVRMLTNLDEFIVRD